MSRNSRNQEQEKRVHQEIVLLAEVRAAVEVKEVKDLAVVTDALEVEEGDPEVGDADQEVEAVGHLVAPSHHIEAPRDVIDLRLVVEEIEIIDLAAETGGLAVEIDALVVETRRLVVAGHGVGEQEHREVLMTRSMTKRDLILPLLHLGMLRNFMMN